MGAASTAGIRGPSRDCLGRSGEVKRRGAMKNGKMRGILKGNGRRRGGDHRGASRTPEEGRKRKEGEGTKVQSSKQRGEDMGFYS